ncbi:hypothetical protein M409DRAFT_28072 [Zasmidium cellare ATCC 36951]|uniref:Uncharacterized protein n=1 Tax=Zasmidium cellare ATCC 36951 TaxID=1080233 RepID=A0A6A6C3S8_ZASCE|nr:uncharacterized protein M409DRAFT_28072 [Zasmidium cellare ATCC 36951]KAF2161675.1 hypothetical protein M409DRAFT_28072 [Zasmidium cellare ATCC 36951]
MPQPPRTLAPTPNLPPASTRLPTELRLQIWHEYFRLTPLPAATHARPTLLHSTPQFRSEALPLYLARLQHDLAAEVARYASYMRTRPAEDCAESTYERWVWLMGMVEGRVGALRREIGVVGREVGRGRIVL